MFGTLIESQAVPERRTASSLASIIIHSAIITAGVIATANEVAAPPPPPPVIHVVHFAPPMKSQPQRVAPRVAGVSTGLTLAAPVIQRLTMPHIIPNTIPSVDLSAAPVNDFTAGPVGTASIVCQRDCASGPATDASGNALWSANEIMMRLLEEPAAPRYPESLRRAGVEGDVVVKFIVDTTGRVDLRSVEVVQSTHDAFTTAVREALAKLRFAPATSGEKRVSALAMMPFRFRLR